MAIKANLKIDQGADYSTTITLVGDSDDPINLEEYIGASQMRKYYTSLTAYDLGVTLVANTGEIILTMSSSVSNSIEAGRYVYDVELTNTVSNTVSRIVEGLITIAPGVTKEA